MKSDQLKALISCEVEIRVQNNVGRLSEWAKTWQIG